ncbi:hypothetical protein Pedsa_2747 [Pseudopedobacter saltans DSM 12145]|uniref:Carboxypeptidase-like regulatory domain-containing protein n=1 Tax=Pseudopedobacter saltans (strain ATCC 51119 / DSM 12145 / JCM 21818 / CCUG 39354 / LMG 10337 / NBRC 100064 / NCIMB 13643) TaxID=762903 RepID=F0S725_PSESL|nr:hypothetical protein [Pseudopedobacter saltans]ADY53288.1 hypothetical protein Pedsa_2747 [Pseudopedobacter saltans DSM 12145]
MKKLFLSFVLLSITSFIFAQETFEVKGIIFNQSKQRVASVNIENQRNGRLATSDQWGTFSIEVAVGDSLFFKKDGFQDAAKFISTKQNLVIYLNQGITLNEVIVKEKSKAAEQKEALDDYRAKGIYFNGNPPLLFSIFHPLSAIHELVSKDAANAKRFGNYISRENAQSAVDIKFNKRLILEHTSIKEENVAEFMYYYRPRPEMVAKWNQYDNIRYIQDSYKKFVKEKSERDSLEEIK